MCCLGNKEEGVREIKFRAWDEIDKKMITGFVLGSVCSGDGFDSDWEVMQYTGCKDKNGKEIYEGDIVKYDGYYVGDYWTEKGQDKVEYDDGCYFGGSGELDSAAINNKNIEIIGNIYENKDLISG